MKTKFTPAPWYTKSGKTYCCIRVDDRVIADMRTVAGIYNDHNAHLIAAAPELYSALESACSEICSLINNINKKITAETTRSDSLDPPDLIDMQTCHDIQLLLAKARGEK